MGWTIRTATDEDIPAVVKAVFAAFGSHAAESQIELNRGFLEVDRCFVAVDGEAVVGNAAAVSLELTVPGPATVPTAGVTFVGVTPTHRRQGIGAALMAQVADDARRRGEPLAALLASESTIYRRFGYGVAVFSTEAEIERPYARLRRPADVAGRVRILDNAEMAGVLPATYDRYRRSQPGEVSRPQGWWARRLADDPNFRGGRGERFAAVWEGDEGYVTYRVDQSWPGGLPGHTLTIEDLVAASPEVRAGLWEFCFGVDLVSVVRILNLALDDPLRWMLVDPRRLRTKQVNDFLWVNLLDVEAALSARTYGSDEALVIDVAGAGRFRLTAGQCRRTDDLADLGLEVADLASTYLGGVSFPTLARAGLVAELSAGALATADRLFTTAPGPASCTNF